MDFVSCRFGADAPKAAKIAASAGFSTVLFVNGGCEGNRGWKESGLPWKEPFRGIDMEMVKVCCVELDSPAAEPSLELLGLRSPQQFQFMRWKSLHSACDWEMLSNFAV